MVNLIDVAAHDKLVTGCNLPRDQAIGRHASPVDILFSSAPYSFRQRKPVTSCMAPCHDESGNDEKDIDIGRRRTSGAVGHPRLGGP